jgi:hypothetical protein
MSYPDWGCKDPQGLYQPSCYRGIYLSTTQPTPTLLFQLRTWDLDRYHIATGNFTIAQFDFLLIHFIEAPYTDNLFNLYTG